MTSTPTPEDREFLAGEYVLGLLQGEDLMRARSLLASDAGFAGEVAYWEDCFSQLLNKVPSITPPEPLWPAVAAATAQTNAGGVASTNGGGAEVIDLQRRLTRWRGIASLAMAAAASLALVVVVGPTLRAPGAPQPGPDAGGQSNGQANGQANGSEPMLAANIPIGDTQLRLALTYVPERDQVMVSAAGLAPDGVHDHELWLVDRQGMLHSLGVVVPGEQTSHSVSPALSAELQPGTRLLLTREPLGGHPEGVDAGPVVAEGEFTRI